jgi:hypothetical protein
MWSLVPDASLSSFLALINVVAEILEDLTEDGEPGTVTAYFGLFLLLAVIGTAVCQAFRRMRRSRADRGLLGRCPRCDSDDLQPADTQKERLFVLAGAIVFTFLLLLDVVLGRPKLDRIFMTTVGLLFVSVAGIRLRTTRYTMACRNCGKAW